MPPWLALTGSPTLVGDDARWPLNAVPADANIAGLQQKE
jgi:hypothetical protein